jgi:hypothetical protein
MGGIFSLSGGGTATKKRDAFFSFLSTVSMVRRDTHVQYEVLLDIRTNLPEDFIVQKGVNNHLFSGLCLLTSEYARGRRPRHGESL